MGVPYCIVKNKARLVTMVIHVIKPYCHGGLQYKVWRSFTNDILGLTLYDQLGNYDLNYWVHSVDPWLHNQLIMYYCRLGMLVHKKTATAVALTGTRR